MPEILLLRNADQGCFVQTSGPDAITPLRPGPPRRGERTFTVSPGGRRQVGEETRACEEGILAAGDLSSCMSPSLWLSSPDTQMPKNEERSHGEWIEERVLVRVPRGTEGVNSRACQDQALTGAQGTIYGILPISPDASALYGVPLFAVEHRRAVVAGIDGGHGDRPIAR